MFFGYDSSVPPPDTTPSGVLLVVLARVIMSRLGTSNVHLEYTGPESAFIIVSAVDGHLI